MVCLSVCLATCPPACPSVYLSFYFNNQKATLTQQFSIMNTDLCFSVPCAIGYSNCLFACLSLYLNTQIATLMLQFGFMRTEVLSHVLYLTLRLMPSFPLRHDQWIITTPDRHSLSQNHKTDHVSVRLL